MAFNKQTPEEKAKAKRDRAFQKRRESQQRQLEKQKAKQSDPKYKAEAQAKAAKLRERSAQKRKEKLSDPRYIEEQRIKKRESQAKAQAKLKSKPPAKLKSDTNKKPIKSKGLKGRTPTALERSLMDKIGSLPCAACKQMGRTNPIISLHHVDGRVKDFAHAKVLPLCAYHHDTPLTPEERSIHGDYFPVHAKGSYGGKKAFEDTYGTQERLLEIVYSHIAEPMPWASLSS